MHDPNILAHEIKYPWFRYKPWPKKFRHSRQRRFDWEHRLTEAQKKGRDRSWDEGYRDTFISIWHKDPERDGSDDSCGWSYPKLTNRQKEQLWNGSWSEAQNPHFLIVQGKEWTGTKVEAVTLYLGMILLVVRLLRLKVSFDYCQKMAHERITWPDCCPVANEFCFLPGYHTNSQKDSKDDRQEHFYNMLCGIARTILSDLRPWYRHPKWHFWHWRLQIHPLQTTWHWLFRRCAKCGKGFKWKETAIGDWNGTKCWHESCSNANIVRERGAA